MALLLTFTIVKKSRELKDNKIHDGMQAFMQINFVSIIKT